MCCSLPAMGQLSSRLRNKEMLVRTVRLHPALLLPRRGLVEGRQQQFAFLSVADQAGSLLGLQGGFSDGEKRKLNIPPRPPVLYTANLCRMCLHPQCWCRLVLKLCS